MSTERYTERPFLWRGPVLGPFYRRFTWIDLWPKLKLWVYPKQAVPPWLSLLQSVVTAVTTVYCTCWHGSYVLTLPLQFDLPRLSPLWQLVCWPRHCGWHHSHFYCDSLCHRSQLLVFRWSLCIWSWHWHSWCLILLPPSLTKAISIFVSANVNSATYHCHHFHCRNLLLLFLPLPIAPASAASAPSIVIICFCY